MKYHITVCKKKMILSQQQLCDLLRAIESAIFIRFSTEKTTVGDVTVEPVLK